MGRIGNTGNPNGAGKKGRGEDDPEELEYRMNPKPKIPDKVRKYRGRKVYPAHIEAGQIFPKPKRNGRPPEIGVVVRKKTRNELCKEMLVDLDLSYGDLQHITGFSYITIAKSFQPNAIPPRWMNIALYIYQLLKP